MLKTFRDHAVVLRRYKLGEADRIVVFLTQTHGQVRAVVKGARKTTSRFGGRLEPCSVVDAQFYQGRGQLQTLQQVETVAALAAPLATDYETYMYAQVMLDIAEKLSQAVDDSAAHYALLYGALNAMAKHHHDPMLILCSYVLRALAIAGWPPRLHQCGTCGACQSARLIGDLPPDLTPSLTPTRKLLTHLSITGGGVFCDTCHGPDALYVLPEELAGLYFLASGNWKGAETFPVSSRTVDLILRYAQWHIDHTMKSLSVLAQGAS